MSESEFVPQRSSARGQRWQHKRGSKTVAATLTELITNSHVSHVNLHRKNFQYESATQPFIEIEAWEDGEYFEVTDNAKGFAESYDKGIEILEDYEEQQETHTLENRSLFGRGLSDAVFSNDQMIPSYIAWKMKGGEYYQIKCHYKKIKRRTRAGRTKVSSEPGFSRSAVDARAKEKISHHGTYVKFHWKRKHRPFLNFKTFRDQLIRYFELRNILSDIPPRVKVSLVYHEKSGGTQIEKNLVHYFHKLEKDEFGQALRDRPLPLEDKTRVMIKEARMYLAREGVKLVQTGLKDERTGGLYIEDEYGQIYDLTLFNKESESWTSRLVGQVILSKEFKQLVLDEIDDDVLVLSDDRSGFDKSHPFYKALRAALGDWIDSIIKKMKEVSEQQEVHDMGDANKVIDKMMKAAFTTTPEGTGRQSAPKDVEYMEFGSSEYAIVAEQDDNYVRLYLNAKEFPTGTNVVLNTDDPRFQLEPRQFKIPEIEPERNVYRKAIQVYCPTPSLTAILTATAIRASDKKEFSAHTSLKSVPTPPPLELNHDMEFVPDHKTQKMDSRGAVTLWMHPGTVPVGSKIRLEFTPLKETENLGEAITFEENRIDAENASKLIYELEVEDWSVDKETNYRPHDIYFTGKRDGFAGKLTATLLNLAEPVEAAECEINIAETGRGNFQGWQARESEVPQAYIYDPVDNKVIFNLRFDYVRKILGDNDDIAQQKAKQDRMIRMFIANTVIDVALEHQLTAAFSSGRRNFEEAEDKEWDQKLNKINEIKHDELIRAFAYDIIKAYVRDLKVDVIPTVEMTIELGNDPDKKFNLEFGPAAEIERKFSNLSFEQWKDITGTFRKYWTKLGDYEFNTGVWEDTATNRFLVSLYDIREADREDRRQEILAQISGRSQEFKPVERGSQTDLVWGEVGLGEVKDEHYSTRASVTPAEIGLIPDSPKRITSGEIKEQSSNWLDSEGNPLIEYDIKRNVVKTSRRDTKKDKLVCLIRKDRPDIMAMNFVRTKIVPLFAALG